MRIFEGKKHIKNSNGINKYLITTNKTFWNLIKPFHTHKGHFNYQDIMIFDGKKFVTNEIELLEICNNHHANNVEKSFGKKETYRT